MIHNVGRPSSKQPLLFLFLDAVSGMTGTMDQYLMVRMIFNWDQQGIKEENAQGRLFYGPEFLHKESCCFIFKGVPSLPQMSNLVTKVF